MSKFLIAGLGNIGDEYAGTRHNIGFEIADALAADAGTLFRNDRLASVAEFKFKGKQIILIKPTTYMNLSGKAINYWLQAEKIKPENLLVLVDELAFPFGQIRIHPKGSDGGHNGLKDIQATLGTQNYARLRFGIANVFSKGKQVDYVLGKWGEEERKTLQERINTARDAVKSFVFAGLQQTMNSYNHEAEKKKGIRSFFTKDQIQEFVYSQVEKMHSPIEVTNQELLTEISLSNPSNKLYNYKTLKILETSTQHTWLVNTGIYLFCILDDIEKKDFRIWHEMKPNLSNLNNFLKEGTPRRDDKFGIIDFGTNHRNWKYSFSLFKDRSLKEALVELVQ